jgi:hypothetical protein
MTCIGCRREMTDDPANGCDNWHHWSARLGHWKCEANRIGDEAALILDDLDAATRFTVGTYEVKEICAEDETFWIVVGTREPSVRCLDGSHLCPHYATRDLALASARELYEQERELRPEIAATVSAKRKGTP